MTSSVKRTSRAALAFVSVAVPMLLAFPAGAAPSGTEVTKVYRLPCGGSTCDSGDGAISDGGTGFGSIQIQAKAQSSLGLSAVTLQARRVLNGDVGAWVCMRKWSDQGTSFSSFVNWGTEAWPSSPAGCSDSSVYGTDTRNAVYDFRVQATDATGTTTSSAYSVKVNNPAARPVWDGSPTVAGAEDNDPIVTLRWKKNSEPDIREYHFIRSGPDGEEEFAVSATKPGGQGCDSDSSTITCYDDTLPKEGFDGDYSYSLVAFRSSPSSSYSCSISPYGSCATSQVSDTKTVSVDEPVAQGPDAVETNAPPKETTSSGGTPRQNTTPSRVTRRPGSASSSSSSYADFFSGEYEKELPYDANKGFALPGDDGPTDQPSALGPESDFLGNSDVGGRLRALRILSGGLIMLLVAAHLARLLRDPADHLR